MLYKSVLVNRFGFFVITSSVFTIFHVVVSVNPENEQNMLIELICARTDFDDLCKECLYSDVKSRRAVYHDIGLIDLRCIRRNITDTIDAIQASEAYIYDLRKLQRLHVCKRRYREVDSIIVSTTCMWNALKYASAKLLATEAIDKSNECTQQFSDGQIPEAAKNNFIKSLLQVFLIVHDDAILVYPDRNH